VIHSDICLLPTASSPIALTFQSSTAQLNRL
jgi:hypothetical protein